MNSERLKEILEKIPIGLLSFLYIGYIGFDYYSFENDPSSPLGEKKAQMEQIKDFNSKLELKVNQSKEFVKTLEAKKN